MGKATRPGYSNIGGADIGACVDTAKTIDDDGLEEAEGKIDIVTKAKQINTDIKIYYAMHQSENRTSTMPDKINKIPILISLLLNLQLCIKTYNVKRKNKQIYCTLGRTEP